MRLCLTGEKMPESKPEEILVIGAGLGGLAAACDLAAAGARVTVLERHSLPGGFATSFNRGRFEFETSLHEVADTAAVQYLKEIVPGLDFLNVPEAYRVILTGKGVDFTAPFGLEQFVRAVAAEVPGSEDSMESSTRARYPSTRPGDFSEITPYCAPGPPLGADADHSSRLVRGVPSTTSPRGAWVFPADIPRLSSC